MRGFRLAFGNRRAQAAEMVIVPGDAEGGPDNRHRGAHQWLFVVAGEGTAAIGRRRRPVRPGTLLLITRGEPHESRGSGSVPLRTLKICRPPADRSDGAPQSRGRR